MAGNFARVAQGSPLDPVGLRQLLSPRWRSLRNLFVKGDRRGLYYGFAAFSVLFWIGLLGGMVFLFDWGWTTTGIGSLLARKLIDLLLLSLFSLLCFSNVIASLSVYYLSDDLELVLALPVSRPTFHFARWMDVFGQSSWMLLLFGLPVFLAFGIVADAGWTYYATLVLALPTMLSIATSLGVAVATTLVNVYPARRTRELMMLLAIVLIANLFVLLRLAHPESLMDPERFQSAAAWMAAMEVPAPSFLPSSWASELLRSTLFGAPVPWVQAGLLATGAVSAAAIARWSTAIGFDSGWSRAQEAREARLHRAPWFDWLVRPLPVAWRPLVSKELRIFTRDPAQWSQIFLLAGLCAVYLVSMSAMPVEEMRGPVQRMVRDAIGVVNVGMGGFLMSAIATRFQFTAVGREGHAWWLVRGAPVRPVTVLYAKGAVGIVPMLAVGEASVAGSAWLIGLSPTMILVQGALTAVFALSLSGLALAMGAWWPEFKAENAARAAQTPGAVFYMVLAQILVFVTMVTYGVGAWALLYTSPGTRWLGWLPIGLGVIINLACAYGLPRRAAEDLWARGI